jgi:hypothetical protein
MGKKASEPYPLRSEELQMSEDHRVLRKMLRGRVRGPLPGSRLRNLEETKPRLPAPIGFTVVCRRCELVGSERAYTFRSKSAFYACALLTDHMFKEHALECAFCFLKFEDFKELANHTQEAHVAPEDRTARDDVPEWAHPQEEDMLPQPGGGKNETQRGNVGGGGKRPAPSVPFIKVEDLTEEPKRAKILAVQSKNTGFNDLIVKLAISGRSYFFGLKASNANYETLFNAFGDDENKWVGEEFTIGLNWNEFYEKNFVHVFEAPAKESKRGKKVNGAA